MENCKVHLNFALNTLTNASNSLGKIVALTEGKSLTVSEVKSLCNVVKSIADTTSDCVQTIKSYEQSSI